MQASEKISPPERLSSHHVIEEFDSGCEPLDSWLKRKARKNDKGDSSRTYVVCTNNTVIGYYCLSAGSVCHEKAIKKATRNAPNPIPVMVLGRLAVDRRWQKKGIGQGLVKDASLRTLQAAEIIGVKAILVHAISERVKEFYEQLGFSESPTEPRTMMVTLKDLRANLEWT